MGVRIATFNVENLFARYRFVEGFSPTATDGFSINDTAFDVYNDAEKKITSKAVKAVDADILCLQEVENMAVLDRFQSTFLASKKFPYALVVDGRDPRRIDVGLLSRFPIRAVRTNRHLRNATNTTFLFSRDCLEVELDVDGKHLTLYVNHLKSMYGGREATRDRRVEQAEGVRSIVEAQWADSNFEGNFVVIGDMNDYPTDNTSLTALLDHPQLVNVLDRLPEEDRWTHYWTDQNAYRQLDYILLSKHLADANPDALPGVMRKGLPYRADRYTGERFDDIGEDRPKASDHAPMFIDIELT